MQEDKSRIESLDSLRGIAAVTVICSHINKDYFHFGDTTPLANTMLHVFYDGEAAVVFFFVLSGFVLSYKYLKDGADDFKNFKFGHFLISRIFRLYPMFWVVLVLTAITGTQIYHGYKTIPERVWTIWWWGNTFSWKGFLMQLSLLYEQPFFVNIFGGDCGDKYVPQAWSLQIELILSLIVPFMVLLVKWRPLWLIIFVMLVLLFFSPPSFIMHFGMGVLLANFLPQVRQFISARGKAAKFILLFVGLFLYSYRYSVAPYFGTASVLQNILFSANSILFMVGLGSVIIIICAMYSHRLRKILNVPLMRIIGKSSYGIYLCHTIILVIFTPMAIYYLNCYGITNTPFILTFAVVFTTAFSILIAYILHHLIELPFIRLGKLLVAKTAMRPQI